MELSITTFQMHKDPQPGGKFSPSAELPIYGRMPQGALFAAIVDSSDDAIISKDLKGTITSWNKGAERIFEYPAAEMIGKPITLLIPPERQEEEPKILAQLVQGKRVDHFETIRVTKFGRRIDISLCISPIKDEDGIIVGASKIARDITDRKRAEEIVRKAMMEAHEASKAKDNFLAALSHELRTPLTPALMRISIIKQQIPNLDPSLVKHLDIIEKNIRTETKLIDALLDLSKSVRNKGADFQFEKTDLQNVIDQAINTCQWNINKNCQTLKTSFRATETTVLGDAMRLEQVLWNVIQNASKFTPAQGAIEISTENVNENICVTLSDNGIGFEGNTEDLFKPFQQKAPQYGGLGMGLAIAKTIMDAHKGTIEILSPGLNKGAQVVIKLPLYKGE